MTKETWAGGPTDPGPGARKPHKVDLDYLPKLERIKMLKAHFEGLREEIRAVKKNGDKAREDEILRKHAIYLTEMGFDSADPVIAELEQELQREANEKTIHLLVSRGLRELSQQEEDVAEGDEILANLENWNLHMRKKQGKERK